MKIFLAAPLTSYMDAKTGVLDSRVATCLRRIIEALRSSGHQVRNAHEVEDWGRALAAPGIALKRDLADLDKSDILVAILGDPPSPGVQLEIGYALANSLPVLLLAQNEAQVPYLLRDFSLVRYGDCDDAIRRLTSTLPGLRDPRSSLKRGED